MNELPMFAKNWIAKYVKEIPIKVPIRRGCMTGSGKEGRCHWNVLELVKRYGGKRMRGFSFFIVRGDYPRALVLTDHSVWITPESKVVDVTINSRTSRGAYQFFIPVSSSNQERALSTVIVPEDYKKSGISVDMRDTEINEGIAKNCNFEIEDSEKFTMNVPTSKFITKLLYSYETDLTINNLSESGGGSFSLPSSATGKYWSEIKMQNLI